MHLSSVALDRQPNADYRARREALAKKAAGVVVLFAPEEAPTIFTAFARKITSSISPGSASRAQRLLIASAVEAKGDAPARPYTEILFLPPRNLTQEKWTGSQARPGESRTPYKITGFDRVEEIGKLPRRTGAIDFRRAFRRFIPTCSAAGESASTIALAFLKRLNTMLSYQDVKPMLSSLRTVKDAGEITLLRKAVDASVAAHFAALKDRQAERQRAGNFRAHAI